MTTKIRLELYGRIFDFCKDCIGKEPTTIEGGGGYLELTFTPSLSNAEKSSLNNALPDFVKKLFKVTVTEV